MGRRESDGGRSRERELVLESAPTARMMRRKTSTIVGLG